MGGRGGSSSHMVVYYFDEQRTLRYQNQFPVSKKLKNTNWPFYAKNQIFLYACSVDVNLCIRVSIVRICLDIV